MTGDEKKAEEAVIEQKTETEIDSVSISPDVVSAVAGLAAAEIEGIAGMSVGLVGGIAEKLGRKDLSKGIRVHLEGDRVRIDMNVIVDLGVQIVEVAKKLKQEVRDTVERITGLKVTSINIHVLGINVPREKEREQEEKLAKEEE